MVLIQLVICLNYNFSPRALAMVFITPRRDSGPHNHKNTQRSKLLPALPISRRFFFGLLHVNETTSKLRFPQVCHGAEITYLESSWLTRHHGHPKARAELLPCSWRPPCAHLPPWAPCVPRCCLLLPESPHRMVCPHSSAGTRPAPVLAASAHLQFIFLGYN